MKLAAEFMKKKKEVFLTVLMVITSFVTLFLLLQNSHIFGGVHSSRIVDIRDYWTVSVKGQQEKNVSLSEAVRQRIGQGDVVELLNVLPQEEKFLPPDPVNEGGMERKCLRINAVRSTLDIYVGGKQIYSYGHGLADAGRMLPTGTHYVILPEHYGGQILRIVMTTNEESAFSGIRPILFGNYEDLMLNWISGTKLSLFIGLFLITLFIVLLILFFYMHVFYSSNLQILYSALTALDLGIYILAYRGYIDFLVADKQMNAFVEYLSLYMLPVVIAGFISCIYKGIIQHVFRFLLLLNLAMAVSWFFLSQMGMVHINKFLLVNHIMCILEGLVLVGLLIRKAILHAKKKDTDQRPREDVSEISVLAGEILVIGVLALILSAVMDIVAYNYLTFHLKKATSGQGITTLMVGSMVFIICLFLNYFYYNINHANEAMLHQRLEGLAYTDTLTELANRTRCEQVMQELSDTSDSYTIISFDVNGLKSINDAMGHAEGDRFLKNFARILKECFRNEQDLIGRMGGDEFIVIMRNMTEKNGLDKIYQLQRIIGRWNEEETKFHYGVSYGMARSSEVKSREAHDVYMLADSRMYDMKRQGQEDQGGEE